MTGKKEKVRRIIAAAKKVIDKSERQTLNKWPFPPPSDLQRLAKKSEERMLCSVKAILALVESPLGATRASSVARQGNAGNTQKKSWKLHKIQEVSIKKTTFSATTFRKQHKIAIAAELKCTKQEIP